MMNQDNVPKEAPPQGDTDLGRRLSSIRLRTGLTQADIAKKVAVSRQYISNIEIGLTSPTLRVLQDYLQVCNTDLTEFFYGPLPVNQTPQHTDYHRKLQALLENQTTSSVITKVLDSLVISIAPLTALVPAVDLQSSRVPYNVRKEIEPPKQTS